MQNRGIYQRLADHRDRDCYILQGMTHLQFLSASGREGCTQCPHPLDGHKYRLLFSMENFYIQQSPPSPPRLLAKTTHLSFCKLQDKGRELFILGGLLILSSADSIDKRSHHPQQSCNGNPATKGDSSNPHRLRQLQRAGQELPVCPLLKFPSVGSGLGMAHNIPPVLINALKSHVLKRGNNKQQRKKLYKHPNHLRN